MADYTRKFDRPLRGFPRGPGIPRLVLALVVAMLLGITGPVSSGVQVAIAALAAVGPVVPAHGFPQYYQDSTGTALEICINPNDANCGAVGMPNPGAPPSVPANFPDEAFWWTADAGMPTNGGGQALLVLALEAAFANEVPQTGQQITFARVRIRVDNLGPGTYTVTHPYGTRDFTLPAGTVPGPNNINSTVDVGGPPGSFTQALAGSIGPFLRWDPAIAPAAPAGYLGDSATPHRVTGSPTGNNLFRITGPNVGGPGVNSVETNLFTVMGKIFTVPPTATPTVTATPTATSSVPTATPTATATAIPTATLAPGVPSPTPTLTPTVTLTPTATPILGRARAATLTHGYPDWYQDSLNQRMALCLDPNDPKCGGLGVEMPNPAASLSFPDNFPAESFYWSAETTMPTNNGGQALLVLAQEAAFAAEDPVAGDQIVFGRIRIWVDNLGPGTYTVTHPYGTNTYVLPPDTVPGPRNIRDTLDVGPFIGGFDLSLASPVDPFLKWDPAFPPAALAGYLGDAVTPHRVTGSPTGSNLFRVDGPNVGGPGVNRVETNLFTVQGKLFVEQPPAQPTPTRTPVPPTAVPPAPPADAGGGGGGDGGGGGAPAPAPAPPTSPAAAPAPTSLTTPAGLVQPAAPGQNPFVPAAPLAVGTTEGTGGDFAAQPLRFFPQTGHGIPDNPTWDLFQARGGVTAWGYPASEPFNMDGDRVQIFQRGIIQQMPGGRVNAMNLLDDDLMPFTRINGSNFPPIDRALKAASPEVGDPQYGDKVVAFINQNVPDEWEGERVNFRQAFMSMVPGDGSGLHTLINLELLGLPTSRPMREPTNHDFVYQRFQRGILHYDRTNGTTQMILLGEWFKAILTGQGLPSDLEEQARGSRWYRTFGGPTSSGPSANLPDGFGPEAPRAAVASTLSVGSLPLVTSVLGLAIMGLRPRAGRRRRR